MEGACDHQAQSLYRNQCGPSLNSSHERGDNSGTQLDGIAVQH